MNLYSLIKSFSFYLILSATAHLNAMDHGNGQHNQPATIQSRYMVLKSSCPRLTPLNHLHLKNYMQCCEEFKRSAIVKGEQEIASEMNKKIGQIRMFLDRNNLL